MRSSLLAALAIATVGAGSAVAPALASHPARGVAAKHKCDPNYKGRCLKPNVKDYDCAGGSGDGPYYVSGPFRVVGVDHYHLDADHDGIACERG